MPFLQEYTMLDELGSGGFATVYKVRHNELGYIRAVRMLKENIATKEGEDPQKTPTYQKFLRECKVLLRLGNGNHPNIVHIYQPRLLDNKALVEMDYVDGQDILHYLQQNQNFVPADEVIRMALQISSALAYCHEDIYKFCMDRTADKLKDDPNDGSKVLIDDQTRKRLVEKYKVIHNDIHSGNIMRREDGNFVLLDFGLSIEGDEVVRSSRRKNGAPEFKAPEKWDNESMLTEQSDIYSFGVVLYQYLAGRVPFPFNTKNPNSTEAEYLLSKAHRETAPPSIREIRKGFYEKKFEGEKYKKDFPQWLEDVILKCLNKNPKDRFRNGKELYEFIRRQSLEENKVSGEAEEKLERLNKQDEKLGSELENLRGYNRRLNEVVVDMEERIQALREETHSQFGKMNDSTSPEPRGEREKKSTLNWWILVGLVIFGLVVGILTTVDHYRREEIKTTEVGVWPPYSAGKGSYHILQKGNKQFLVKVKGNFPIRITRINDVEGKIYACEGKHSALGAFAALSDNGRITFVTDYDKNGIVTRNFILTDFAKSGESIKQLDSLWSDKRHIYGVGDDYVYDESADGLAEHNVKMLFPNGCGQPVKVGDKWRYILIGGEYMSDDQFDEAYPFCYGKARVCKNGRWYYIDGNNQELVIHNDYNRSVTYKVLGGEDFHYDVKKQKVVAEMRLKRYSDSDKEKREEGEYWAVVDETGKIIESVNSKKTRPEKKGEGTQTNL